MVKAMDMPVHNIHGFCHASMGNVMAWQNSYYMTFVMLYEFCHAAWVLPYNPLFDPWHAVTEAGVLLPFYHTAQCAVWAV